MIHQQTNRLAGSILQMLSPTLYNTGRETILVVVYILLNIYLLCCFVCYFSTLDIYSRLSTFLLSTFLLSIFYSRLLLSTLDNYVRLSTFTLDPRLLDTLRLHCKWTHFDKLNTFIHFLEVDFILGLFCKVDWSSGSIY